MNKEIGVLLIILAMLGIGYVIVGDTIILDDGKNTTINMSDYNLTEIMETIDFNRLNNYETTLLFENLLNCYEGEYKHGNLNITIEKHPPYRLCYVSLTDGKEVNETYMYNIQRNKELDTYIRIYWELELQKHDYEQFGDCQYCNNPFVMSFIETGNRYNFIDIINSMDYDYCDLYDDWIIAKNDYYKDNDLIYNKLEEECNEN